MEGVASSGPAVYTALGKLVKAGIFEKDNGGGKKSYYRFVEKPKTTKKKN